MYVHVCMYVCMYLCSMHVCMYVCVCLYVYAATDLLNVGFFALAGDEEDFKNVA